MENKCNKYEALFTFCDDETFKEHLKNCPDCQKEHEKMERVSELLKEVRPYYKEKRKNVVRAKLACALFALCFSSVTLGVINLNTDISDTIKYGSTLTAEDLGLPVDSYGFIMVE